MAQTLICKNLISSLVLGQMPSLSPQRKTEKGLFLQGAGAGASSRFGEKRIQKLNIPPQNKLYLLKHLGCII